MVKRYTRGVTLTELVIVIAILGIVVLLWPKILMQSMVFLRMNRARLETTRDARTSMQVTLSKLRQASASSIVLDQKSGQPPYSRISFIVGGSQYLVWQDGRNLMFSKDGAEQRISDNLRSLNFTYPDLTKPDLVAISITMEKKVFAGASGEVKAMRLASEKVRILNP
jgi:prepilin-type N-terminal cleavage/methylation domain-containing protein